LAVAETFNTSKITSDLLAKHNLEPTELAKHILSADAQATQLFSTVEMAFYQRIIEVSCTYIIDIASQLPTFTGMPYRLLCSRFTYVIHLCWVWPLMAKELCS